jgi:nucleotide-binding universal stress UspA family protein
METGGLDEQPVSAMTQTIVLCGVDGTDTGTTVLTAAKAAAERSGSPLLLTHVVTSAWGANVPAFQADGEESERLVEHGPPGARLLAVADGHAAELIVIGTRAKRWRSVARQVAKRAQCPVMIVGPVADPNAPAVEATSFNRAQLRSSPVPVLVLPRR